MSVSDDDFEEISYHSDELKRSLKLAQRVIEIIYPGE